MVSQVKPVINIESNFASCLIQTVCLVGKILKSGPHRCDRIQREICQKIEKSMACLPFATSTFQFYFSHLRTTNAAHKK